MVRALSRVMVDADATLSVAEATRVFDDIVRRLPGGSAEIESFRAHVQLRLMPHASGSSPMPLQRRKRREGGDAVAGSIVPRWAGGALPGVVRSVERAAQAVLGTHYRHVRRRTMERVPALLTLIVLQSASALVMGHFERLIEHNHLIPMFLTMVVGAGGNAGSQAATAFLDEATLRGTDEANNGKGKKVTRWAFLSDVNGEIVGALAIATLVGSFGFVRVLLSSWNIVGSLAISLALCGVVFAAVILGTALPSVLVACGIDPVHSAPSISVCMDLVGVAITCVICSILLPA